MIIKVLGSGCANCRRLEANVGAALAALQREATIEHVTDPGEIAAYGVMRTPGLVVDDQLVVAGRVAGAEELAGLLA